MNQRRYQPTRRTSQVGTRTIAMALALLGGSWALALNPEPVQVGARGDIRQAHLDFHGGSGHLFAVLLSYDTGFWYWLVNMSTDGGATWTETYEWESTMGIDDIDAVVVDDYLYVAYIDPLDNRYAKIRRFSAITGAVDSAFGGIGWIEVLDGDPHQIDEVALASSADDLNRRLYYFAAQSDGALRYAWTNQEGGADTPWSEIATGVTSANHSIEATYAENSSTFLYVAYEGFDDNLHVWRRMDNPTSDVTDFPSEALDWVRISAFEDTVVLLYDVQVGPDRGIDYVMSTDAGETWAPASLTPLDNYTSPAITLRKGGGVAAVYHDVTSPDWAALTQKDYSNGDWTTPLNCSIPGLTTGSFSDIERLPIGDYGVLFVGSGTSSRNAFFALPLLLFGDGFESDSTAAWSSTTP